MDINDQRPERSGISRRSLLGRGAIVGGTAWAAPVIHSLSAPAFAQGLMYGGGRTDLSYIALVYDCGSGPRGLKIDVPSGCQDADTTSGCDLLTGCDGVGATPSCGDFFRGTPSGSCDDLTSGTVDANGNVTIVLRNGCRVTRVAGKCGSGTSACRQTPSSSISVGGNSGTVTVSDNFCPSPVGA